MTQIRREISFILTLSEELEDRLRISAQKEKGKVIKFVVQYKAFIGEKWKPIVRL